MRQLFALACDLAVFGFDFRFFWGAHCLGREWAIFWEREKLLNEVRIATFEVDLSFPLIRLEVLKYGEDQG